MLDKNYFDLLMKYTNNKYQWKNLKEYISINIDYETEYMIYQPEPNRFRLYIRNRNDYKDLGFFSEKNIRRIIAFKLKCKDVYYCPEHFEEFREIKDFQTLIDKAGLYCNPEYYSINNPQINKINLYQNSDGTYDLYFMFSNGNRKYSCQSVELSDANYKLYLDTEYYERKIKILLEYSELFNDFISYEEKINLIFG
ncbi:MAG: hypothetical protein MJ089_03000 [Ruminococcus sp.]|nr:hypothetical protein [Ruminococcus sp.]